MRRWSFKKWRRSRFAAALAGVVAASLVWLALVPVISRTPDEAKADRAPPRLPEASAKVVKQRLQAVGWSTCGRNAKTVQVAVPKMPAGFAAVVTAVAAGGSKVKTGTVLAEVSGIPLVAVRADVAFYRDLRPGDRGSDVRVLQTALARAGVIASTGGPLSADTVSAWRQRFDPGGPVDRIRLGSLVAVPKAASVGNVLQAVGTKTKQGAPLLEVTAGGEAFVCDVLDLAGEVTAASVRLQVDGGEVAVDRIQVKPRTSESPGQIVVWPKKPSAAEQAQLGIEGPGSDGAVLAVPLAAVKTAADGSAEVVVIGGGEHRAVEVKLGVSAQGLVEISGEDIGEGDQVRLFGPAGGDQSGGPAGPAEPTEPVEPVEPTGPVDGAS